MRQHRDNRLIFCAAAALLLAAFGVSLCIGRYPLALGDLIGAMAGKQGMAAQVFWRLRLPRSLAVCASGVALGACGAVYQALFGNPLAAPDIMGVSGGATLGAAVAIVMLGGSAVALAAFAGGMAALAFSFMGLLLCPAAFPARGGGSGGATFAFSGPRHIHRSLRAKKQDNKRRSFCVVWDTRKTGKPALRAYEEALFAPPGPAPCAPPEGRRPALSRFAVEKSQRQGRLSRFAMEKSQWQGRLSRFAVEKSQWRGRLSRFAVEKSQWRGRLSRFAVEKS